MSALEILAALGSLLNLGVLAFNAWIMATIRAEVAHLRAEIAENRRIDSSEVLRLVREEIRTCRQITGHP
jgi:hypothetical protein